MGEFDGATVLVTGGGLGIGRGVAKAFAEAGASVVIADLDGEAAEATATELTSRGLRAAASIGDVSSAADASRMVSDAVSEFGRLDVLVNNAGIQPPEAYVPIDQLSEELWDRILAVNLKGVFLMSRAAIPELRRTGGGSIVNMASVQGLQSMPGVGAYAASKGGILSLTRNMALDYAPDRIRVNAICPGTIDSEMVRAVAKAAGGDVDQALEAFGLTHPLRRIGLPADVANATLFLASERASFVTGTYLCVDGGYMALGAWAAGAGAKGD